MRPDEYWKNFNLGTELDIAGRFLFNGLQAFHEMEHFAAEEDSFEFLYSVAVGIERLLKIAIILTEHDPAADQEAFEKKPYHSYAPGAGPTLESQAQTHISGA